MLVQLFYIVSFAIFTYASDSISDRPAPPRCRCIPSDPCWPSKSLWNTLNTTVHGQLIRDVPLAQPCYSGPLYDEVQCKLINSEWGNATFQQLSPAGLCYPSVVTCPPVNSSHPAPRSECSLGTSPTYTVNATKVEHVVAALKFAEENNVRLVVRNTGHDLLDRSTGYGSVQIWIKYLRTGVRYHKSYEASDNCSESTWNGSAFTIGGGYVWSDVYPEAEKRNLLVVGGGTPSVGAIGGWMQGGGHSPATHNFGLGADQVLEAQVVLANGSIVTTNPCQHPDLFFAIRGGGPGTYGIVTSTTIKAWPSPNVVVQTLAVAPLTSNHTLFMEALADIYTAFPALSDGGFSGYGSWSTASPTPIFSSFTTGYAHAIATMGMTQNASEQVAAPLLAKLAQYNTSQQLTVNVAYYSVPNYAAYYNEFSGTEPPVGSLSALASRLLDRRALTSNRAALLETLTTLAGTPEQQTTQAVVFVGGGAVFSDAMENPVSAVNPAWRRTYVHHIVSRAINATAPQAAAKAIRHDITYNKSVALKSLAPDTGCYMNEADRLDPDWEGDFYGGNLGRLKRVKKVYDEEGVLWCPTCVGSEEWGLGGKDGDGDGVGALCRV